MAIPVKMLPISVPETILDNMERTRVVPVEVKTPMALPRYSIHSWVAYPYNIKLIVPVTFSDENHIVWIIISKNTLIYLQNVISKQIVTNQKYEGITQS